MANYDDRKMGKKTGKKKAARRRRKIILLVVELLILLLLLGALYIYLKLQKVEQKEISKDNIVQNDFENENIGGFTNIALFGVDSRDNGLESGNSDAIMIASINNKTKDVKLVSIYRDTYLNMASTQKETYFKANSAYNSGGPEQAINMMNLNLDLNVTDYVTVSFKALVQTIDLLGGIDIEITEQERIHMNNYAIETSKVTGMKSPKVTEDGMQHLDGVHATSFARIRYTEGDDYKRTERQRLVIEKMLEKAKTADLLTLNNIIDTVAGQTSTSLSTGEMISLAKDVASYNIADQTGFPFDKTTDRPKTMKADCVFPIDLEKNVVQLHTFLFGNEEVYSPSAKVKEISNKIKTTTGIGDESGTASENNSTKDTGSTKNSDTTSNSTNSSTNKKNTTNAKAKTN